MQSTATAAARLILRNRCHFRMGRTTCAAIRFYRGEATEGVSTLSAHEEALLKIAKPKSDAIYQRHIQPVQIDAIPKASFDTTTTTTSSTSTATIHDMDTVALDIRRKRLIYRSKQRGWLEVDLLLGTWASQNVPMLNSHQLDEYEAFCNMETIDIYNVVTLRLDVPEHMKSAPGSEPSVVEQIQAWARESPLGKADPEQYKSTKASAKLI